MKAAELRSRYQSGHRDFQGVDLQAENLAWTDLSGVDLSAANLRGVNFSAATLKDALLKQANLTFANLSRVDLTGATLYGANLEGVNLSDAHLEGVLYDDQTQWPQGFDISIIQTIASSPVGESPSRDRPATPPQNTAPESDPSVLRISTSHSSKDGETAIASRRKENLAIAKCEQLAVAPTASGANIQAETVHQVDPGSAQGSHPSSWQLVHTINAHRAAINAFAISPDNQWLTSGGDDRAMHVWNLQTGQYHFSFHGHGNSVTSVAISPDGEWIASGCWDKKITAWNLRTKKLLRTFIKSNMPISHDGSVNALLFRSGRELVSAGADQVLCLWNVENGALLSTLKGHQEAVETFTLALSKDGRWLVSSGADKTIRVWDLTSRKEIRTLVGHQDWIQSVAIAPQGQPIISGSADGVVKVWKWVSETELYSLKAHDHGLIAVDIHPSGKFFASAGDRSVKLWDLDTGALLSEVEGCAPIIFSADGTKLVTGGAQYTAKIWQWTP
jgi:WD40 repeat protein